MTQYHKVIMHLAALMFLLVGIGFALALVSHSAGLGWFLVGDSESAFIAGCVISATLCFAIAALIRAVGRRVFRP